MSFARGAVSNALTPALALFGLPSVAPARVSNSCGSLGDLDTYTSGDHLSCFARHTGTALTWVVVALLLLYLGAAVALRFIPLSANAGLAGTLRRAREQLPIVGRSYRPKIAIDITEPSGETKALARTMQELLIDEMTPASSNAWFNERLVGDELAVGLGDALDDARPGLGKISKYLISKLPQQRFRIHVQLHQSTATAVALTAEFLDRSGRSLASKVFSTTRGGGDDGELIGYSLLVRPTAAWLSFQLFDFWPGEQSDAPNPVNTRDPQSYGEFRRGVLLEGLGRIVEARAAYHLAIDIDPHNVGALLNLALIDSRDMRRIELCRAALNDAAILVDDIIDVRERTEMIIRIKYVRSVAALNEISWRTTGTTSSMSAPARRHLLAKATGAVQDLAATLRVFTSLPSPPMKWQQQEKDRIEKIAVAYEHRTIALAAAIAVEHELIGIVPSPIAKAPRDVMTAVNLLADGVSLSLAQCTAVLTRPGEPLATQATYSLACALARRTMLGDPDQKRIDVAQSCLLLREALAGSLALIAWALGPSGAVAAERFPGDPAFESLVGCPEFDELLKEFCQIAAAPANT